MSTKFSVAVSLVIAHDGKILLARRSAHKDHAPGMWEGISGRLEAGESPVVAAHREALEETGLLIEIVAPIDTFHFYRGLAREETIGVTFHCRVVGGQLRMSEEHDTFAWITLKELEDFQLPDGLAQCIRHVFGQENIQNQAAALAASKVKCNTPMPQNIACIALVVPDYDVAIAHYTQDLGFDLVEDTALPNGQRWVLVAPPGATGSRLLLAKAKGPEQLARVGDQTGGRVFLFLNTDDFWRDHARYQARGVQFLETPREESYATVAVFQDKFGNKWDLLQPKG